MNIDIRKLTPNLAEDYAHFFDTTPHDDGETKCYCVTWCGDNIYLNGGSHWFPSPMERRVHAVQRVKDGDIQGYLAYCDDRIVGWCNANTKADCRECINYLRSDVGVPLEECCAGEKIKFVFCFAVAPDVQRKGVATRMLEYICEDAAADGFDFVEAFVYEKVTAPAHDFRGPLTMYEKCGFVRHAEKDGKVVVRKPLK
jgi:GNAT superfamily N-acetyltransferase